MTFALTRRNTKVLGELTFLYFKVASFTHLCREKLMVSLYTELVSIMAVVSEVDYVETDWNWTCFLPVLTPFRQTVKLGVALTGNNSKFVLS